MPRPGAFGCPDRPLRTSRRLSGVLRAVDGRTNPRTARLRELLAGDDILVGPCCHDALSARLIERAGFDYAFMSGFCTSAARLGAPDTGLISYAEMLDQGRCIHEATRSLPIIGDGDTGYGNALNVKRTVRGYADGGFAGILIEDQVAPKSCGHVKGKRVVGRDEAVARVRAAVDARDEGADILIVARTDARQAESLEEALARVEAFAAAGADVVFIDALASEEEMHTFAAAKGVAGVARMASMLEGGGKTPILSSTELQAMGFGLVAYPLSVLGVAVQAMEDALKDLKSGSIPAAMPSFDSLKETVGFEEYYAEEARYTVSGTGSNSPAPAPEVSASEGADDAGKVEQQAPSSGDAGSSGGGGAEGSKGDQEPKQPAASAPGAQPAPESAKSPMAVEADRIIAPWEKGNVGSSNRTDVVIIDDGKGNKSLPKDSSLKIKITEVATGKVKLVTNLPAGWIQNLASMVPEAAGIDLEQIISATRGEKWDPSMPLVDNVTGTDRIQVFLIKS